MKHILLGLMLLFTIATKAQVGIGTSSPDYSARLQIDANAATNAKGFLLPRVTATQKGGIVSPATGLIVYQTDGTQGFYYYDGSSWKLLPSASNAVPYTGATRSVDLGNYDLTVNGITVGRGSGNISSNTASGDQALYSNTTGSHNTASGDQALYSNTTGFHNTASGYQALYSNIQGYYNLASGPYALYSNTIGSSNTATGYSALYSNTTGIYNTANGLQALYYNTTGWYNTATGSDALVSNTTGYYNVAIGSNSLYGMTTGSANTAIGYGAGSSFATGNNCTMIGYGAQASSGTISNEITLGNSSVTTLRCNATTITALSDRRDKTDIIPIVEGLAFLKQLNPVSFTWNTRDKAKVGIKSAGFIAQELLALQKQSNIGDNLDLVSENNPEKLEARYGNLLPVIVKAIQEESAEKDKLIKIQNKEIKILRERLDAIEKQINQMLDKK
jgi:hypothetical protein